MGYKPLFIWASMIDTIDNSADSPLTEAPCNNNEYTVI